MIILASSSLRRRALLKRAGFEFKSLAPSVDETPLKGEKPEKFVERLAIEKAMDAERKINFVRGTDIFIGVDTVGLLGTKVLGKPKDDNDAKKILRTLSGKTHIVMSAVALKKGENIKTFIVKTKVKFRKISTREINNYVRTGEPLDKAAGYAIQGRAALFVEKVDGDFFNVVGLPLFRLGEEIEKLM